MTEGTQRRKVTVPDFVRMKAEGQAIAVLTAYDYPMAMYLDKAGVDAILVGDSLAMVELGMGSTLQADMEMMIHHTKSVTRAVHSALVIGDVPFLAATTCVEAAVENAGRFLQEAGADAVKVEGGEEVVDSIRAILRAGIPVMGHLGLTPQSFKRLGGYGLQAGDEENAALLLENARILEEAGCFAIVLEKIPTEVAEEVTRNSSIPTIGIGAGPHCDGQVLVTHDMLGLYESFRPKFARRYAEIGKAMGKAFSEYVEDVRLRRFPSADESFAMDPEALRRLLKHD